MAQPETISLVVDELNDGEITADVTLVFERFDAVSNPNRSIYTGEENTLLQRDQLAFYRSFPKKNGNFNGVAKSAAKFTFDIPVDGADGVTTVVAPILLEMSFSVPVGATAAQVLSLRQRAIALLDSDDIMSKLNNELQV